MYGTRKWYQKKFDPGWHLGGGEWVVEGAGTKLSKFYWKVWPVKKIDARKVWLTKKWENFWVLWREKSIFLLEKIIFYNENHTFKTWKLQNFFSPRMKNLDLFVNLCLKHIKNFWGLWGQTFWWHLGGGWVVEEGGSYFPKISGKFDPRAAGENFFFLYKQRIGGVGSR